MSAVRFRVKHHVACSTSTKEIRPFNIVLRSDGFFYGKVIDYAGGGAVHMVGGVAALSGAWILGPRIGRFEYDEATKTWISRPIPGHNAVLAATGTFILWMGFL